jgi:3',5'-cyclic AMP phosphodiesterase CpdA
MKFIHFTDPHLVAPGRLLHGLDPLARLEACIDDINARHADAGLCVVTGDLADRGEPEAYAALSAVLARLAIPVVLLLGNHDSRAAYLAAFPKAETDASGFVQAARETPAGTFLFLDTLLDGSGAGHYGEDRVGWLEARLAEAAGRPVYVFMHHPPFDIGMPALDRIRLLDEGAFAAALAGHRQVRHIFFGHAHRPISGAWRGIPFSTLRATSHQVALEFAEVRPMPYTHEPPEYAVVFLEEDRTVVHTHNYLDRSRLRDDGGADALDV